MNIQMLGGALIALAIIVGVTVLLVATMLAVAFLTERTAVTEAEAILREAAGPDGSNDASQLKLR
jgi:flagellar basal body-associated protein FliL